MDDPPSRERPIPADWLVGRALEAYLAENGFTHEQYDAPRTPASFLGVSLSVPNPPHHRWAIMLHDLHHVATGYGTDPAGEGEISAWEFRRGIRPLGLYTGAIVTSGVLLGVVVAPRRTLRAWRESARSGRASLFHRRDLPFDAALGLPLGDLRRELGIPVAGLWRGRRGTHSRAPG